MKNVFLVAGLLFASQVLAHDEGHGPKISGNAGEQAVISAKEIKLGAKAKQVLAATLERLSDDDIAINLKSATSGGSAIDASKLSDTAEATLKPTSSKKKQAKAFKLTRAAGTTGFKGSLPHLGHGLYELEVKFKQGSEELFVAFPSIEGHGH